MIGQVKSNLIIPYTVLTFCQQINVFLLIINTHLIDMNVKIIIISFKKKLETLVFLTEGAKRYSNR